jgi:hypothetical protein
MTKITIFSCIIGKTWDWENKEPYTFIEDLKQIEQELASGKRLYKATKQAPSYGPYKKVSQ